MRSLYESLLDDEDEVIDRYDPRADVEKFIKDNYKYVGNLNISNKVNKNGKYEVSCPGTVEFNGESQYLTNNLFEWSEVGKWFGCFRCTSLKSLEGAPQRADGVFYCVSCYALKSLEGAPKKVGEDFICNNCSSLTSLEGAPRYVGADFSCSGCSSLKTLKGAPEEVDGFFYCGNCSSLTSLEGAPKCEKIISNLL